MKVFYNIETGEIIQVTNSDYITQETNFIEIDEFPAYVKPKVDLDKMTIIERFHRTLTKIFLIYILIIIIL